MREDFTEEEAVTKLCPMTFPRQQNNSCVGSNCMWWKWTKKANNGRNSRGNFVFKNLKGACSK